MASKCDVRMECKICHECYVDPHMLECGHSFCKLCIDGLSTAESQQDEKQNITCPLCKATSSSTTKNYAMLELIDAIKQPETNSSHSKVTSLKEVGSTQWKQQQSIKLENVTNNIRIVDKKLWTCHSGGCTIYTLNVEMLKKVNFHYVAVYTDGFSTNIVENDIKIDDSVVYDIGREGKNTLIVASDSGLWRAFENGMYQERISDKPHTGICASTTRLLYVKKKEIVMINLSGQTFTLNEELLGTKRTFNPRYGERHLSVTPIKHDILACNSSTSKIECYSLNWKQSYQGNKGELLGKKNYSCYNARKYGKKLCTDDVELDSPFICCSDDDGNVLIADCGNDRLLLRSTTGKYKELDLQPPVIAPNCAVFYEDKLFVVSWHHKKLFRYECASNK